MQLEKIRNYLTIDVEEHFQVSAFENVIRKCEWSKHESRVAANTEVVLRCLDQASTKATFFIVGWVAEHNPEVVLAIDEAGHEIGCHSYLHRKVYDLTPDEFREDTHRAKSVLEDITGKPVNGYRAPSYSITKKSIWALRIIEELGFKYDSSIFPVYHDTYGIPGSPRYEYVLPDTTLKEYPISTLSALGFNIPVAGGGYFRLFPYWLTRALLKLINAREKKPFIFYLHPWEIDPKQPRVQGASIKSKWRHYNNLNRTLKRFESLLADFSFKPIG